ncbi:MAG: ComEC/Rec2 family competence protein [Sulfurimonas sp.]
MEIGKPQLFSDTKSFVWVMSALSMVLILRLFFSYQEYRQFISKPFYYTYADVVSEKSKTSKGRRYKVLKLHADNGLRFITTAYDKNSYAGKRLRLQIFPDEAISFRGYLSTFFVRSRIKEAEPLPGSFKEELLQTVALQHEDPSIASFYNAILFAAPLEKRLREQVSKLGVSHLVALSGFHLGILWGLVYGVMRLLYRPLQQRYFPYRFALLDVGSAAIGILAYYVWFVDAPPSLLRSYAMVLAGWGVLLLGMELVSFAFLFTVVFLLLALFPSLAVSLSFWFSVAGVFAIFLLLKYTKHIGQKTVTLAVIPTGIFILMLPVVHSIFPVTTPYQLLSPLLSLLFIPFYPLAMAVHLAGHGGVFDTVLLWLFALPDEAEMQLLPARILFGYILLALLSMRYKGAFVLLSLSSLVYAISIFLF